MSLTPIFSSVAQLGTRPHFINPAAISPLALRPAVSTCCVGQMLYRGLNAGSADAAMPSASATAAGLADWVKRPHMPASSPRAAALSTGSWLRRVRRRGRQSGLFVENKALRPPRKAPDSDLAGDTLIFGKRATCGAAPLGDWQTGRAILRPRSGG